MILVLAKITELVTQESGKCFLYEFGLDTKLSANLDYKAVVFQMLVKDKLPEYEVGEYYTFISKSFITASPQVIRATYQGNVAGES